MNTSAFTLDGNDFLIRISPLCENGKWTGRVDVSILSSADNSLNETDFNTVTKLAEMVASSIPVMEHDDYVLDTLEEYADRMNEALAELEEAEYDDNVIKLDVRTKTRGNA